MSAPALALPDASPDGTVSVRPAPHREPPFDDEVRVEHRVGRLDRPLPFEAPVRTLRSVPPPTQVERALPDPAVWGRRLLVGVIESASGHRTLQQLSSLLSPAVARGLGTEFERAAAGRRRHWLHGATVRSVHAFEPAEGVAELCATLTAGSRARAVAIRLEESRGRWRCVLIQVG